MQKNVSRPKPKERNKVEEQLHAIGPITGLLIKLVFAQQYNNSDLVVDAARELGETGNPQLMRAATQFLGASKYHTAATIALQHAPSTACKTALHEVLQHSSNPLKRQTALSILGERQATSSTPLASDVRQNLSVDEHQRYIASWVQAKPLRNIDTCLSFVSSLPPSDFQNYLSPLTSGSSSIEYSELARAFSLASNKHHVLNRSAEAFLGSCGTQILPTDCSQLAPHARTILAEPHKYYISTLELAQTVFDRSCVTPTKEILVYALSRPNESKTISASLARHPSLPELTIEERLSVARRVDAGENFGELSPVVQTIFERAVTHDNFDSVHKKAEAIKALSTSTAIDTKVIKLCTFFGQSLFEGPQRAERILSALRNQDTTIAELGRTAYEASFHTDKDQVINTLLIPGERGTHSLFSWAIEELDSKNQKSAIQKAISICRNSSDSNWQEKAASEYLHGIAHTPSYKIIRDQLLADDIVPTEHSYRTLSWPALCMIEHTLQSPPIENGKVILLPSRIIGKPEDLLKRGFKFGSLYAEDVNQIEATLPDNCSKCMQVEASIVYVTAKGFPIARTFLDRYQDGWPMVLEAFPYSETDTGDAVTALVNAWLKPSSKNSGLPNKNDDDDSLSLELVHGIPIELDDKRARIRDDREQEEEARKIALKKADLLNEEMYRHLHQIHQAMELSNRSVSQSVYHKHDIEPDYGIGF